MIDDDPRGPGSARTPETLGQRVRRLRRLAGLSQDQLAARSGVSKSTISAIENGRLPRWDNLQRLLAACDVDPGTQRRWLDAVVEVEAGTTPAPEEPAATPATEATPPADTTTRRLRRPRARWVIGGVGALALVAALVAFLLADRFAFDMRCEPATCVAPGTDLTLDGHLTGDPPPGHEVWLLLHVDNANRWYLGQAVVPDRDDADGTWSRTFTIGNPASQAKDRHLRICGYLLPSAEIAPLTALLVLRHGDGVTQGELPADRRELTCVNAVRAAGT